jgi:hypothetical protein
MGVYTGSMTIDRAQETSELTEVIELVPSPWERAAKLAADGQVAWLSEQNQVAYALFPADLAHAALEALEELEDLADAEEARKEPRVPYEQVKAEIRELEAQGR